MKTNRVIDVLNWELEQYRAKGGKPKVVILPEPAQNELTDQLLLPRGKPPVQWKDVPVFFSSRVAQIIIF
jgi:hypothetical protein